MWLVLALGTLAGVITLWQGVTALLKHLHSGPRLAVKFTSEMVDGDSVLTVEIANEPIYSRFIASLVSRRSVEELEVIASVCEANGDRREVAVVMHDPSGNHVHPVRLPPSYRPSYAAIVHVDRATAAATMIDWDGNTVTLAAGTYECRILIHDGAESFEPEVWVRDFLVHTESIHSGWVGRSRRIES
jgi:hypothetical protein